jgi:hypothetical protein
MSALSQIPIAHWQRLGLLLIGLLISLGLLWWVISRSRPRSQREVVTELAREDPEFFPGFAHQIGEIVIRYVSSTQRWLCRIDDPKLNAKQQALLAQSREELEALGFTFVGFLVPCSTLQGLHRVDEPSVLFLFIEQERQICAAATCTSDALMQTEFESESMDGSILGTVVSQPDVLNPREAPGIRRGFVPVANAEALAHHRQQMTMSATSYRTFEGLDDIVASQRRQEVRRLCHELSKGAPGWTGIGQLVSQDMPWYWLKSARMELAKRVDQHIIDWRPTPAEIDAAVRVVSAVPHAIDQATAD